MAVEKFGHIRNLDKFFDLTDWTRLNRELPGKMRLSDCDGKLERNGYYLMVEVKDPNVDSFSKGLSIELQKGTLSGQVSYLVLWAKEDTPHYSQLWTMGEPRERNQATWDSIGATIRKWLSWASRQDKPKPATKEIFYG